MGLKKTDAEKARAKAQRKKNRKWVGDRFKDAVNLVNPKANRQSKNPIARAKHDIKVKEDDKKFTKKWEARNKRAKNTRSGSGLSAADRLEARKRHRVSQEKKQDRAALKKSDPAKYKAQKSAERRKKLQARIRGRRS